MGQTASEGLPDTVENVKGEIARQARSLTEIATLTYEEFLGYLNELNHTLSNSLTDSRGCKLVFAVKKGTDSSILWKGTVRIACVRVNVTSNKIESFKLLNLNQFLKAAHTFQSHAAAAHSSQASATPPELLTTSLLLQDVDSCLGESLGECCICLERKPDVILPCAHSYCLPCIEQWNVNHKTCPICREKLDSTDDSWVISEAPGSEEISQEIQNSLLNLSGS